MLGYPGAGKTTTARIISKLAGAELLWADHVRREKFTPITYSHEENIELYTYLNELAVELLYDNKSVVFDTNFNYHKDRQYLRRLASKAHAHTVIIWVKTPKEIAYKRASENAHEQETRVLGNFSVELFEKISSQQEDPQEDEQYIMVDGTKVTEAYITYLLGL